MRILGLDGKDGLRLINGTENLMIAVSGGAGRHSCVIPTFGNTRPVTVPVP
jgi:hypothetical protein